MLTAYFGIAETREVITDDFGLRFVQLVVDIPVGGEHDRFLFRVRTLEEQESFADLLLLYRVHIPATDVPHDCRVHFDDSVYFRADELTNVIYGRNLIDLVDAPIACCM